MRLPAFVCLSVCLSVYLSIYLWSWYTGRHGWAVTFGTARTGLGRARPPINGQCTNHCTAVWWSVALRFFSAIKGLKITPMSIGVCKVLLVTPQGATWTNTGSHIVVLGVWQAPIMGIWGIAQIIGVHGSPPPIAHLLVTHCRLQCVYVLPLLTCSASNISVTLHSEFKVTDNDADQQIGLLDCRCKYRPIHVHSLWQPVNQSITFIYTLCSQQTKSEYLQSLYNKCDPLGEKVPELGFLY